MSSHLRGILQVALASVCYGFIGVFGKQAFASGLSIGGLLTFRYALSAVLLALVLVIFSWKSFELTPRQWLISFLLGAVNCTLSSVLYFTAIQGLSIALAALLLYTFPLWAMLINFVLGERMSGGQFAGILAALTGLVFLLWGEIRVSSWHAAAAGLGSGLSYAIYVVLVGRFQRRTPAVNAGFWIIAGTAVSLWMMEQPPLTAPSHWSHSVWLSMMGTVVIGTVVPLLLVQSGLQKLSSTEAAVFSLLEPVTAVALSVVTFGDHLRTRQLLGGALVLGSLVLLSRRRSVSPAGL